MNKNARLLGASQQTGNGQKTMVSQTVHNGQKELEQRRATLPPTSQPRSIAEITPGKFEPYEPPPVRRLERVTLSTLDTSHPQVATAVKMARAWAARKRDGYDNTSLVLCGPNGVGKTHIARAIWWSMTFTATDGGEAIPGTQQPSGKFFLSNDLIGLMGVSKDPETGIVIPVRASSIIGNVPMVVIDDVGAEQAIPFVAAQDQEGERHARFFKIVDHCYTANISLIITSNCQIAELAGRVGKRAWDRIAQMAPRLPSGETFIVDMFNVGSYRMKDSGR